MPLPVRGLNTLLLRVSPSRANCVRPPILAAAGGGSAGGSSPTSRSFAQATRVTMGRRKAAGGSGGDAALTSTTLTPPLPPSSSLDKKPCRTCGREMKPDAKQVASGNSVETCSHSCRVFRIGKKPNQAVVTDEVQDRIGRMRGGGNGDEHVQCAVRQVLTLLEGARTASAPAHPPPPDSLADAAAAAASATPPTPPLLLIDVDAWIELTMLDVVQRHRRAASFATCEDVEGAIMHVVRAAAEHGGDAEDAGTDRHASPHHDAATAPPSTSQPKRTLANTLESGPGLRERVRRAARRLFILPRDKWASAGTPLARDFPTGLDVLQNGKVVDGLAGVSFAKGTMQLRVRRG